MYYSSSNRIQGSQGVRPRLESTLSTLESLLREADYGWMAGKAGGVAERRWRRSRRKAVASCRAEIWDCVQVLFAQWNAVATARQDFEGVDPHWERLRIWALLSGISLVATWTITLSLPAPARLSGQIVHGLRQAALPVRPGVSPV